MRKFKTGATRDSDENKLDYEGFLSPSVIEAFGQYMHKRRRQADGGLRDSDNWQKGMPKTVYAKSAWRHFMQFWKLHRGLVTKDDQGNPVTIDEAMAALMFNIMGYFHEHLKQAKVGKTITATKK